MKDLFEEIFNDFSSDLPLGFRRDPLSIRFSTPKTKDIEPAAPWRQDGNTYKTTIRCVGINPEDVKVSLENYGINITGKTEEEDGEYSQDVKLGISKELMSEIEEVLYTVKNGLCKITLVMKKEQERKQIPVTKV